MFNTKKLLITISMTAVLASITACNEKTNGKASSNNADITPVMDGKYASNFAEIIKANDGKYLDSKVIEAILGEGAAHGREGLKGKLDHNNPYSFEVDDSIDGGNHGNAQCKVPLAFTDVQDSASKNYKNDTKFVAHGFGTPIAEAALKKWDITVDGDGKGLPPLDVGMTVEEGGVAYVQFCGMCHGEFGEGAKGYLPLAVEEDLVASDPKDPAPMKAVGNYWPYAVTFFDYIRRTMPFWTPNAAYIGDAGYLGMTGYIMQANYVPIGFDEDGSPIELEDDTFYNAEVLMKQNKFMKNQGNFFCDHRPVIHNARCMSDCDSNMVGDGTGDIQNFSEARTLPDGTPQYNVPQRMHEDPPGVGHSGM